MTMSAKLLKFDDVIAVDDLQFRDVEVPEWGGTVRLRALSAAEAKKFNEGNDQSAYKRESALQLVALAMVDEEGNRVIKPENLEAFRKKSVKVIMRLATIATELNEDVADRDKAKND
jgi:hypothetical protein